MLLLLASLHTCTSVHLQNMLTVYFLQVRNDDQKLHPLLCPISSLSPEDSQYDYTMAYETLATLLVLGYHIIPPDSRHTELEYQQLDEERYQQSNGYLPRPLNLDSVRVEENLMSLVTRLAENCHNVWAAGRIKQGWTYGRSNVSPHTQLAQ